MDKDFILTNGRKIYNKYGKLIQEYFNLYNQTKTPYSVIYYHINVDLLKDRKDDLRLGGDNIIRDEKFRWNKITNFPIYLTDTVDFDINFDDDNYIYKDYEGGAVIHSQIGLVPFIGDIVLIPYPYDEERYLGFYVSNTFQKNTPEFSDYYGITLKTYKITKDVLDKKLCGEYNYIDIYNKIYDKATSDNIFGSMCFASEVNSILETKKHFLLNVILCK